MTHDRLRRRELWQRLDLLLWFRDVENGVD